MITKEYRKAWYRKNRLKVSKQNKRRYDSNPVYHNKVKRNSHLKQRYGVSATWYDRQLEIQGGCCAICGITQTMCFRRMDIDHSHISGKVRGLLCHLCNVMLGSARDNPKTLEDAAIYLLKSEG